MTRGSSQWRYHGGASWLKNERKKSPACRRGGGGATGSISHPCLSPSLLCPLCLSHSTSASGNYSQAHSCMGDRRATHRNMAVGPAGKGRLATFRDLG